MMQTGRYCGLRAIVTKGCGEMGLKRIVLGVVTVMGLALALAPGVAAAQTEAEKAKESAGAPKDIAEKAQKKPEEKPPEGWSRKLSLGGTFSFSHSSNVVGSVDGTNLQIGLVLDGSAILRHDQLTWENLLKVQLTQSRTPVIDDFVKSADNFELQSTLLYRLRQPDWMGPYGRVRLVTSLFKGYEVRAEDTIVRFLFLDGTQEDQAFPAKTRIDLTGSLEPLVLSENAGFFANPVERDDLYFKTKLGFGFQHVIVGQGFAIKDDKATAELELKQLEDATQGGVVLELNVGGKLAENVTWKVDANFFGELFSSSDTDVGKLNTDVAASLSVKLAKWASLDYVLNLKRIPILLDEWQVQSGLVLTAGFDLL
jgi:hypothetical protein